MRPGIHSALALTALAIGLAAGCSSNPSGPGYGTMRVRMTDAPADVDEVNLVITEVSARQEAVADSDAVSGGWIVLSEGSATYDLLDLRNGVFTTIGEGSLPAGRYSQVRLKIGTGSTVVVDGVSHPLVVPSGAQSGLKLQGDFNVPDGGSIDIGLDFDAARSIHQTGNGTWMLKPVIKVMPITSAGSIRGQIVPDSTSTTLYLIQATDTLGSTAAGLDGRFQFSLLSPGSYAVAIAPDSGYRDTTLAGLTVTTGATTDVGVVELTAQ
ncbi:MAG: DUF4382 domain-containing protein [Candidatus Eisenbacteria bacterium]